MSAFDAETCRLLARALERAWHMFTNTRKAPLRNRKKTHAALARCIVEVYERGERNEVRIAFLAVARLDQQERQAQNRRAGNARHPKGRFTGTSR